MGNCCGGKPQKVQQETQPKKQKSRESTQQEGDEQELNKEQQNVHRQSNNQIPQLPKKKRVKETVKMVQSIDANGNKILNEYYLHDTVGRGSFGKVKKASKQKEQVTEELYAIKILKKSQLKRKREFYIDDKGKRQVKSALDDVRKEIAIMKKLNHENVIKLYEVIENESGDKLYLVLDFAEGGQLIDWDDYDNEWVYSKDEYSQNFSEMQLKKLIRDCVKGLNYLHSHNIIHRDIKPQNILLDKNGNAMLADFGVSLITDEKINSTEGTYYFMAPEVLDKEKSSAGFSGQKADIWSLGISFYCFAYLVQPFFAEDQFEFIELLQKQDLKFPAENKYGEGFTDLLQNMLQRDANIRISLQDISKNKWINEGFEQSLEEEMKVNKLEEVSEEDIRMALQLSTVVRIKKWVQSWKSNRKDSQIKQNSESIMIQKSNSNVDNNILNPNQVVISQKTQQETNFTEVQEQQQMEHTIQ